MTIVVVITERYHVLHVEVAGKKVKNVHVMVDIFQKPFKKNVIIAKAVNTSVKITLPIVLVEVGKDPLQQEMVVLFMLIAIDVKVRVNLTIM